MMENITFNCLDANPTFLKRKITRERLTAVVELLGYGVGEINYVFCSDNTLLEVNRKYLNHDTLTDVITFDYSERGFLNDGFKVMKEEIGTNWGAGEKVLSGDIYISVDRVRENARLFHVKQIDEMNRVLVHGVLHLAGYKDKKPEEEVLMRKMENKMLAACFVADVPRGTK